MFSTKTNLEQVYLSQINTLNDIAVNNEQFYTKEIKKRDKIIEDLKKQLQKLSPSKIAVIPPLT